MRGHPAAQDRFYPTGTYLDTASYGLPPAETIDTMEGALNAWRQGTARWQTDWDAIGEKCRDLLAGIVGSYYSDVALIPAVSVGVATVASALPHDSEILVCDDEFASILWPLLAAAHTSGIRVRRVPFDQLVASINPQTTMVATSHVRSKDGKVADLDALAHAAKDMEVITLIDVTHSAGILPVDMTSRNLDFVVGAAYKHLLCPRGTAFLGIAPSWQRRLSPLCASWRGQPDPYRDYFGGDLSRLRHDAGQYDVSLAWFSWLGAYESLRFLHAVNAVERRRWCVGLADELAKILYTEPTGSSVLAIPIRSGTASARDFLHQAGVQAACADKSIRVSFHLYNDLEDVGTAAAVLRPLMTQHRDETGEVMRRVQGERVHGTRSAQNC